MISFEDACRGLNIPSDRIGLVKRNIELKTKLTEALACMKSMQESVHEVFNHSGDLKTCVIASCRHIADLIEMLQP